MKKSKLSFKKLKLFSYLKQWVLSMLVLFVVQTAFGQRTSIDFESDTPKGYSSYIKNGYVLSDYMKNENLQIYGTQSYQALSNAPDVAADVLTEVFGNGEFYLGKVIQNKSNASGIRIERSDGSAFNISSLKIGAGKTGKTCDAIITGTFKDNSTLSVQAEGPDKYMGLVGLNWINAVKVDICFAGGGNDNLGSIDDVELSEADVVAPTSPENLMASNIAQTSLNLVWNISIDSVGVTGYDVFQDGVFLGNTPDTSFQVTGLSVVTKYIFTVTAFDASGNVSDPGLPLVVTTPDIEAPSVPQNLVVDAVTDTGVDLIWSASTDNVGVTGYEIFQDDASIGTTADTSFTVSGLTASTGYGFTVSASDSSGNVSEKSIALDVITLDPPVTNEPLVVFDFAGTAGASSSPADFVIAGLDETETYNVVSLGAGLSAVNYGGVDGFEFKNITSLTLDEAIAGNKYVSVYINPKDGVSMSISSIGFRPISQSNIRTFGLLSSIGGFTASAEIGSVSVKGVDGNFQLFDLSGYENITDPVEFRIYVYGYNNRWEAAGIAGSGNDLVVSGSVSGEGGVDTEAPSIPQNLVASNITQYKLDLSWDASTDNVGVAGYEVFMNDVSLGTTIENSLPVTGLSAAESYTFAVKAKDGAGNESETGEPLTVTTPEDNGAPFFIDFEDAQESSYQVYTKNGFVLEDYLRNEPLLIYGTGDGYPSNVIHNTNWSGGIRITKADNTAFSILSLKIGSGRYGSALSDATITATFVDNTTSSVVASGLTKVPELVTLNWEFVLKVEISFKGDVNNRYGAIDDIEVTGKTNDSILPSVPQNLMASNVTRNTVDLSWDASTDNIGVLGYEVYQDGVLIGISTSTQYRVDSLAHSTTYNFSIAAKDYSGNQSTQSDPIEVSTRVFIPGTKIIDFEHAQASSYDLYAEDGFVLTDYIKPDENLIIYGTGNKYESNVIHNKTYGSGIRLMLSDGGAFDLLSLKIGANAFGGLSDATIIGTFTDGTTESVYAVGDYRSPLTNVSLYWFGLTKVDISFLGDANNNFGSVDEIEVVGETSDTIPPSIPQNLAAGMRFNSETSKLNWEVDLSWEPSQDNLGFYRYEVFQDGISLGELIGTKMTVTGLKELTSPSFTVVAKDISGNTSEPTIPLTAELPVYPNYTLTNPIAVNFLSAADSSGFNLFSNVDWTITSDVDWITVSPSSGSGDTAVSIYVTANNEVGSRIGTLTFESPAIITNKVVAGQKGQTALELPAAAMGVPIVSYFLDHFPFADAVKTFRWVNVASWDENGYPTSANIGTSVLGRAGVTYGDPMPDGEYVLTWEGDGDVEFYGSSNVLVSEDLESNPKRRVYNVSPSSMGVGVQINSFPASNIHLWVPGLENNQSLWNPAYINYLSGFKGSMLRMMRLIKTNSTLQREWSDRTPREWSTYVNLNDENSASYQVKGGVSYEAIIELANEMNTDMWISIPHLVSDDYITKLAHLIKTGVDMETGIQTTEPLNSNLRVWLEYSNEVWNNAFKQTDWVIDNIPGNNLHDKYTRKSVEVFNVFKSEFRDDDRLVRVLASQTISGIDKFSATYQRLAAANRADYDVVAISGYFTYGYQDFIYNNWNNGALTHQQFYDFLSGQIGTGPLSMDADEPVYRNRELAANFWAAEQFNVPVIIYEANDHFNMNRLLDLNGDGKGDTELYKAAPGSLEWMQEFARSQFMYDVMEQYQLRYEASGLKTYTGFVAFESWSQHGQWGFAEYMGQPLNEATKYRWIHDHFNLPYPVTNSLKSASILASSLNELNKETNIKLYPNPSNNGRVILELQNIEQALITIFNMDGKVVYQDHYSGKQQYISTSGFKKGLYIVKVKTEEKVENLKLIVQ